VVVAATVDATAEAATAEAGTAAGRAVTRATRARSAPNPVAVPLEARENPSSPVG
jgi:hypothetical protein